MATDISLCHLTTRDHLILETMIEHCRNPDAVFEQMLQRKVRNSQLYLREDIPTDVATLECWVTYQINGQARAPRQLVAHEAEHCGGDMLSIHSVHGLALLGLAEGATATVEADNGRVETIILVKVVQASQAAMLNKAAAAPRPTGDVISFRARKAQATNHTWHPDDDPGPSAA